MSCWLVNFSIFNYFLPFNMSISSDCRFGLDLLSVDWSDVGSVLDPYSLLFLGKDLLSDAFVAIHNIFQWFS